MNPLAAPQPRKERVKFKRREILYFAILATFPAGFWLFLHFLFTAELTVPKGFRTEKSTLATMDVKMLCTHLRIFEMSMDRPPSQADGLQALVTNPGTSTQWQQLLREIPLDPWEQPYQYRYPAEKSSDPYDIFSKGPDRKADTEDDIGNWH